MRYKVRMGQSASNMQAAQKQQQSEVAAEGHWVSDIKTGYRWATDPIVSGEDIVKKPLGNVVPQFENNNNVKMIFSLPNCPVKYGALTKRNLPNLFLEVRFLHPLKLLTVCRYYAAAAI